MVNLYLCSLFSLHCWVPSYQNETGPSGDEKNWGLSTTWFSHSPHDLDETERYRRRGQLVVKVFHPDRCPGKLPVKLFAVLNFLEMRIIAGQRWFPIKKHKLKVKLFQWDIKDPIRSGVLLRTSVGKLLWEQDILIFKMVSSSVSTVCWNE